MCGINFKENTGGADSKYINLKQVEDLTLHVNEIRVFKEVIKVT